MSDPASSDLIIQSEQPLLVRDGRPNHGRSASRALEFPFPQTVAGVVRTRLGSDDSGAFVLQSKAQLDHLRRVRLDGPLPVRVSEQDPQLLWPTPRDAVWFEKSNGTLERVLPLRLGSAVDVEHPAIIHDLTTSLPFLELPILPGSEKGKPPKDLPKYVSWAAMEAWLTQPNSPPEQSAHRFRCGGWKGGERELRTHVAIDEWKQTAVDGALFTTVGIQLGDEHGELGIAARVWSVEDLPQSVPEGVYPFGGKRRLARFSPATLDWPKPPQALNDHLANAIVERVRVRVLLATPAHFAGGALPSESDPWFAGHDGLKVRLVSMACGRPITVSGWDFETRAPKATRRLVGAGAVYWLELEGVPAARLRWLEKVWLHNASSGEQEQNDGYGLTLVGVA